MTLLPHDADAERALLGAFMIAPSGVGNICAEMRISSTDFYGPGHRVIFDVLQRRWAGNEPIDLVLITAQLRQDGTLVDSGGPGNISEIFTFYPTAANASEHAEIIKDRSLRRKIIEWADRLSETARESEDAASEVLLAAQLEVAALDDPQRSQHQTFRQLLDETLDSIERGDDATADIASGIQALDRLVRMRFGNVIIIAGEAKSGKTALAGTILVNAAVCEKRCALFSLEMSGVETVKRMLACAGRVNVAMIGKPMEEHEVQGIQRGHRAIANRDITIITDLFDLGGIVARARQLHAKKSLDLIILDYLQLVEFSTGRKGETRQEIVAQISRTCKRLAGELHCVVIALSQLNDEGKLRESRAIGQDANAVIAVEKTDKGGRVLRIVAQRNGVSGEAIPVQWLPQYTRMEDI